MTRPMPIVSIVAATGLALFGAFIVAIFSPPLFNGIFGEEGAWEVWGVVYGIVFVAAAIAWAGLRNRLGLGASLILGLFGFMIFAGLLVTRISDVFATLLNPQDGFRFVHPLEIAVSMACAALSGLVIVGVITAARRWGMLPGSDAGLAIPAALLAGIGFAFGLAGWGGEVRLMITPVDMPMYEGVQSWLPAAHFVAAAALVLGGRYSRAFALAVALAGGGLTVASILWIATFGIELWYQLDALAAWSLLGVGYAICAYILLRRLVPGSRPYPTIA